MTWASWVDGQLGALREGGRWREVRTLDGRGPVFLLDSGREVVSFASNDYLGLSQHPAVLAGAEDALRRWGAGSTASRLIVGSRPVHTELEAQLASWRGTEAAVLYSTGYGANVGVLSAVAPGARIVSDELNHASIIDGARLARAEVCVYRHGDADHAAQLVAGAAGRCVVVSDTVFSMDGDVAPITELSAACARHGALLVLDDAHAVLDVPQVDPAATCIRVGTLSKALGALGGYATGPRRFIDFLINRSRPFIFTTAPSPADTGAALAALDVYRSAEGARRRARLRANVDAIRPGHPSPIVPIVLGSEGAALAAAAALLERGLLVPAIRPPTVPPESSRLRLALSSVHTDEQLRALRDALGA